MNSSPMLFPDPLPSLEAIGVKFGPGSPARRANVVISLVMDGGKVLLIRRDIPNVETPWIFPGGKIEPKETVFQASAREVLEETGVFCRPRKIVSRRRHPATGVDLIYVLCDYVSAAKKPRPEFRTKWLGANYIDKLLGQGISKPVSASLKNARRSAVSASVPSRPTPLFGPETLPKKANG
jgi:8-oxo-dGTP diphosphatase